MVDRVRFELTIPRLKGECLDLTWLPTEYYFGFWILDLFQSAIRNPKSIWLTERDLNPQLSL